MKRFIFIFALGALLIVGGQIALTVGLHPENLASFRVLLQGGLCLVLGAAIIGSGMLGLAEGYEEVAGHLGQLLGIKRLTADPELAVKSDADLTSHNQGSWRAYRKSSLAVCLFLAGILGLAMALARGSLLLYVAGLAVGIAVLGMIALRLGFEALRVMRRTHQTVERSATLLAAQPPIPPEAAPVPQPQPKWAIRRERSSVDAREPETQRRRARVVARHY